MSRSEKVNNRPNSNNGLFIQPLLLHDLSAAVVLKRFGSTHGSSRAEPGQKKCTLLCVGLGLVRYKTRSTLCGMRVSHCRNSEKKLFPRKISQWASADVTNSRALRGVYSDTTELNWTELNSTDLVEQRTAKSVVFLFMTSWPTNWVNCCSRCRVELSWVVSL